MNQFVIYIIPAGNLTAVKAKLQQGAAAGLTGLPGMFVTPCSPSGTGNATHYVSSGIMSAEECAFIEANLPASLYKFTAADGDVWAALQSMGLTTIPGSV